MPNTQGCVFCDIVEGRAPATIVHTWGDALAIRPLLALNDDHLLVIPRVHVRDAAEDPAVTAQTMHRAAQIVGPGSHIGVNVGVEAGQTVFHLHVHTWMCRDPDRCMPYPDRCMPWE